LPTPTPEQQRRARIFGALFGLTFVTSIAALALYDPILNESDYILGDGDDARIQLGAYLEVFLAITNIGTAVVIWPIVRRQSETLALSFVASRTVEATFIVVGAISLLSILTLQDDLAGSADAGSLSVAGESLVALHDWTFLIGPGFCVGVNGLVLGYLFYKSGLVPPTLAMFGVIGGPLIFVSATAVLFGAYDQTDGIGFVTAIPEIIFEGGITIYTLWKGFRPCAILDDSRYAMA
jgi:hypothetical protein